nr:hypothetical protein [Tanacetum cinerariifolium]
MTGSSTKELFTPFEELDETAKWPTYNSKEDRYCNTGDLPGFIREAGSRDRPPMLATGRYPQWRSRFLRYIDTRPNGDALRKCILSGPYKPTTVLVQAVAVAVTDDSLVIPEHTTVKTPINMSPANKAHFEAKKEAIHLILTGIGDEIYSTVDACQTAQEMWEAIERLQQGESLNIQDVKTNLFLEFALVATAQANQDPYYQTSKSHKSYVPSSKPSIPTKSHTTTRYKGKEIAKPIIPPSESASEEDNDPEQAKRDKDMQKNLALIAKYFKKIYKPTNNNLRTSLNLRNKNVDTTPWYKNDNQSGQFGNQRTVNVAGARENECRKPKRVKDSAYHKEKMLLCKQAEKGVSFQVEQYDWLADTDEEIDEQELEAHYSYMEKIQENKQTEFEKYKAFNDRSVDYDKLKRLKSRIPLFLGIIFISFYLSSSMRRLIEFAKNFSVRSTILVIEPMDSSSHHLLAATVREKGKHVP